MNSRTISLLAIAVLCLLAAANPAIAVPLQLNQNINVIDSFREAHPLLMGCFHLGGILLLIGVCASAFSISGKSPRSR